MWFPCGPEFQACFVAEFMALRDYNLQRKSGFSSAKSATRTAREGCPSTLGR